MYVKSLYVKDFRNYLKQEVELSPKLNIFTGDNAQGKTNLLEAVYLTSVGKSPRTPRDKELIRYGCDRAFVKVVTVKETGSDTVEIILDKSVNKRIAINTMPISRMGELMGVVPTVLFMPDEMKIVKNAPSDRRRFMDIALCQISRGYFYLLNKYDKTLSQRNKLLKSGRADADSLDVWDMLLADSGSKIIKTRKGFVKRIEERSKSTHSYLTDGKEDLSLEYDGLEGDTVESVKDNFIKALRRTRDNDLRLGYTHIGPHKDDIAITLGDIDLRSYGSQGQQRTASLSLKLAEAELIKEEVHSAPLILLDDVLSELDEKRRTRLIERIQDFQVIITCTDIDGMNFGDAKIFRIESGKLI